MTAWPVEPSTMAKRVGAVKGGVGVVDGEGRALAADIPG